MMRPWNAARLLTAVLTLAAAAFGSLIGLAISGWGGVFFFVPFCTALFGAIGALAGAAVETEIRRRYPEE